MIELDPSVTLVPDEVIKLPPYELGGEFTFLQERLIKVVWHNSYDALSGDLKWWWSTKAARLPGVVAGGPADVLLDGSQPAWIDGGPRQALPFQDAVMHHESIELGRVRLAPRAVQPAADLAPDQLEAVAHQSGPARIIAPAGSGKTRVLVSRLRHLIDDRGIEPELITALAYNNRAADEMRSRLPSEWSELVRTFHSLGLAIVSETRRGVEVAEEMEVRERLRQLAPAIPRPNTDVIAPYLGALDAVRVGLAHPAEVEEAADDVAGFAEVFEKYRDGLFRDRKVDFGEMIYGAIEALCADPGLRRRWQQKCRHLLVDEFQDLAPGYLLLIRLLSSPGLNVFGVGDDDQVIYGFQAASPRFLIDYEDLFPGAAPHALEVNYRCPKDVVEAASNLLSHNEDRVTKVIRPASEESGLRVMTEPNDSLAERTVDTVKALIDSGTPTGDIAILARVNSALLSVQVAFALHGIPLRSALSADILKRTLLRATFAWWRIALDPESIMRDDLYETIRRPSRGLNRALSNVIGNRRGRFSIDDLIEMTERFDDRQVAKWSAFCDDIVVAAAGTATTAQLLDVLVNEIGLGRSADALDSGRSWQGVGQHGDDLTALRRLAALCPDPSEFVGWIRRLLATPSRRDGVLLSSVHKVKGLEWDHVVVFGADAGTMPHRLAGDTEEERRVFHVAITRGIRSVTVIADEKRPSPFLEELTAKAPPRVETSTPTGLPHRRPRAERERARVQRARANPSVSVIVGDQIRVTGGYWGTVVAIHDLGVTVKLNESAELEVAWGEKVRKGLEAGALSPGQEANQQSEGESSGEGSDLRQRLRRWRLEKTKELGVPAFVIFNDRTLDDLVRLRPKDEASLLRVHGIGTAKLESFGDDLLEIISESS